MSLLNRRDEFWKKFEIAIFEILSRALVILKSKSSLPESEDELNRCLYFCLVEANYELQKVNKGLQASPFYEGNNQPHHLDLIKARRENKRPDFQWSITDINEADPLKSSKQFVLECKRLGTPKNNWILNSNYIEHGINRFISNVYGYAEGAESAAMLGYVQSMKGDDILREINQNIASINQPPINRVVENQTCAILTHTLTTSKTNNIRLEHVWVDLRKYYL